MFQINSFFTVRGLKRYVYCKDRFQLSQWFSFVYILYCSKQAGPSKIKTRQLHLSCFHRYSICKQLKISCCEGLIWSGLTISHFRLKEGWRKEDRGRDRERTRGRNRGMCPGLVFLFCFFLFFAQTGNNPTYVLLSFLCKLERWVKSGINRWLFLYCLAADIYKFYLKGQYSLKSIKPVSAFNDHKN